MYNETTEDMFTNTKEIIRKTVSSITIVHARKIILNSSVIYKALAKPASQALSNVNTNPTLFLITRQYFFLHYMQLSE